MVLCFFWNELAPCSVPLFMFFFYFTICVSFFSVNWCDGLIKTYEFEINFVISGKILSCLVF